MVELYAHARPSPSLSGAVRAGLKPLPPVRPGLDEQSWPVYFAILTLAGFVAGIIIALSDFAHEPRLLYSGWSRLASLLVTTGLLLLIAYRLRDQTLRRGLQLGALASIVLHFGFISLLRLAPPPPIPAPLSPAPSPRSSTPAGRVKAPAPP